MVCVMPLISGCKWPLELEDYCCHKNYESKPPTMPPKLVHQQMTEGFNELTYLTIQSSLKTHKFKSRSFVDGAGLGVVSIYYFSTMLNPTWEEIPLPSWDLEKTSNIGTRGKSVSCGHRVEKERERKKWGRETEWEAIHPIFEND